MSKENVEVVRSVYEDRGQLMGRDGAALVRQLFDPEVRMDMSRRVFNPATYEGYEGLRQWARDVLDVWETFEETVELYREIGDRVVVIARRHGTGRESGVPVDDRSASIWTLRAGRIVRVETDLDPAEA